MEELERIVYPSARREDFLVDVVPGPYRWYKFGAHPTPPFLPTQLSLKFKCVALPIYLEMISKKIEDVVHSKKIEPMQYNVYGCHCI